MTRPRPTAQALRGCFGVILSLMVFLLLPGSGCGPLTFTVGTGGGDQTLKETVVEAEPDHRGKKVAVIDISGFLVNGAKPGLLSAGENPVSLLYEQLAKARDDKRVKAVILRINSPGGGVTASDLMYRQVLRFKARTGKPVVAQAMDVTASGGYYIACSADHIVAQPTSVVGSIGVIMQTISVKPALSSLGIQAQTIASGPNKAAGSPLEVLTDEQRAILTALVDDFYQRFTQVVRTRRPTIPPDRFGALTDGRVMSGDQAAAVGLVDQTGDLYVAFDKAKALAGIDRARLVLYHRPYAYVGSPYATHPGSFPRAVGGPEGTQINLAQFNLSGLGMPGTLDEGFYYLWTTDAP